MTKTIKIKQKNLDNQFHGGRDNALGNTYEVNFFVQKIVEMVVANQKGDDGYLKIKRGKRNAHVDDIYAQTKQGKKFYHQCKRFLPDDRKELYADFINEYLSDNLCELWLVTQGSAKELRELTLLAKREQYAEFVKQLDGDRYKKEKSVFKSIQNCFPQEVSNSGTQTYGFLLRFNVLFYDEIWSKEQIVDKLNTVYERDSSERIKDRLYSKAMSVEWTDQEITWDEVRTEIQSLNPQPNYNPPKENNSGKSIIPTINKSSPLSILADSSTSFKDKLDYLFKLIDNRVSEDETRKALCIIKEDKTLAWHFLKNLKDPAWFPKIKDNVIKTISEDTTDSATKYQLLSFFEKCSDKYSDEILPFILALEKNTQSYHILSNLVKTTGLLKPKSAGSITLLWQFFDDLVEHQHPWVRREIPKALLSFIGIDEEKVFELFRRLFTYSPPPQDVTQGSPTLALTFQGSDNENWVFEEAIQALSELLSNPKYAEKAHALAREVEKIALAEDEKLHDTEEGITLDYSSIWLSNKSFESSRLEYNHDRKERVILEIEKSANALIPEHQEMVEKLLIKMLEEKYEVFYLTVIKVLIKHSDKFATLSKSLIFDPSLWKVHNIKDYFLQTLATTYFKTTNDKELIDFVTIIDQQKLGDDRKTFYLKQSMLVSIPEDHRTKDIIDKLDEVSEALKVKPGIAKPFAVTTWSGIRPDITVEELKKKNEDELIQIMVDSTNGKRAASYDTAPIFAQLIDLKVDLLPNLLMKMKGKKIAPDFAGEMVESYKNKKTTDIVGIANLISLLDEDDSWARIEVARYFNELCRKKEIQDYTKEVIDKIREALLTLTHDKNPEADDNIKSSNPRPDDAITRGINSVRGIATEALVAFCHYFPTDQTASKRLIELADDNTTAVKATLIYSLRYMIGKNFSLCEEIINKFRNRRDPEIDFALIHFFSQLDCEKFLQYQDFVKLLFNSTNEQISEDMGELVGYRYINGCDVQALLDEIIGNRKGTKHTLRSLAFVFESQMGNLIGHPSDVKIASYLKKLMNPQNEPQVIERAAFVFQRDEIKPEHFEFMDKNGLTTELILNKFNLPAQSHLVDYLQKCVEANVLVERCVELLHSQVTSAEAILSDHLITGKIASIVAKLLQTKLSDKTKKLLEDIFNAGLERGWDEFYTIYHDSKSNIS